VQTNPFAALPIGRNVAKRERVLSDDELVRIWNAAADDGSSPYGAIIRLMILTGQRRGEVAGIKWDELSDNLAVWTIPGERTKNGLPHIVPLSEPARALLSEHPRQKDLVFPGDRQTVFSGWSKCKTRLDTTSGVSNWRLHDLRRTVATGLQRLGVRLEVTEAVLNHVSGSRAGIIGIYQRHDWAFEKRTALEGWSAHVLSLTRGVQASKKVVALTRSPSRTGRGIKIR
jgi:integrase